MTYIHSRTHRLYDVHQPAPRTDVQHEESTGHNSFPARPISEGAAPCPYCLAPCPMYIAPCPNLFRTFTKCNCCFLCFQTADVKNLVKCLQMCAHVFINRPQNCAQTSFCSRSKLCPILCRLRTMCPNFGHSRARLCPIYFAHCPFPNLAGTLYD